MNPEIADAARALIEAARAYRNEPGIHEGTPGRGKFCKAVDALDAAMAKLTPNKPYGFKLRRPWELVPAGWFVQVPNGEWYEVTGTKRVGAMQEVGLRSPAGRSGAFPRNPEAEVTCRRGTHTKELSDAIEALSDVFGPVQVLEDTSPPWDES